MERRLNTRQKRHFKAHSLVGYRAGLKAIDRAGRAMMDQAMRRRKVNQLTSLRLDDKLSHVLNPVPMPSNDSIIAAELSENSENEHSNAPVDVEAAKQGHEEETKHDVEDPTAGFADELQSHMRKGFIASTMRTFSRLMQTPEDEREN